MTEKEALDRVVDVLGRYRLVAAYDNHAVAALVLDALGWPRSGGTVPARAVLPDGCVDGHSPDLVNCELGVDWP